MSAEKVTFNGIEYNERHGGPFDRGSADSWYQREPRPHYYVGDTGSSELIEEYRMTEDEIQQYLAGYEYNEQCGGKKDYE
jgi:hypothetical protein